MLYVIYGPNKKVATDKALSLVQSLQSKKPDATLVKLDSDNWNSSIVQENLGGQGLFSNKYVVFFNRVCENASAKEGILDFISAMKESTNIFIVLEGTLNVELKKSFEKYAEKMVLCEEKTAVKKSFGDFNIFALGDALGEKKFMNAWALYRKALEKGLEVESILGTIFWQMKSILLASRSSSASEAGLSPFVFNNCKRFARNYSAEELENTLRKLITIYHDGHRGLVDMDVEVEGWVVK